MITAEQKQYLLDVYLKQGYGAAAPIAIQYGVDPKNISKFARATGHRGKRGRLVGQTGPKGTPNSPRWQKAIERGAVIA